MHLLSCSCQAGHAVCANAYSTCACASGMVRELKASASCPACSRGHASCRHLVLWHGAAGAGEGQSAPGGLLLHKDHPGHCAWRCAQPADVWLHTQILKSKLSLSNTLFSPLQAPGAQLLFIASCRTAILMQCPTRTCLSPTIYTLSCRDWTAWWRLASTRTQTSAPRRLSC